MPKDPEEKQAARSKERGVVAAGIQDSADRKKFIAAQGEGKMSDADLDAQTFRVRNEIAAGVPPTMHDGGKVKKDGPHNLEKGEVVIPKDKVMNDKSGIIDGLMEDAKEKAEPKKDDKKKSEKKSSAKSHRPHTTHVQHHPNGSHTLTFHHKSAKEGGPDEMMSQAVPDDEGMHQAMQSAMAGPEPEAGEAAAGAGAAPAAAGPAVA